MICHCCTFLSTARWSVRRIAALCGQLLDIAFWRATTTYHKVLIYTKLFWITHSWNICIMMNIFHAWNFLPFLCRLQEKCCWKDRNFISFTRYTEIPVWSSSMLFNSHRCGSGCSKCNSCCMSMQTEKNIQKCKFTCISLYGYMKQVRYWWSQNIQLWKSLVLLCRHLYSYKKY